MQVVILVFIGILVVSFITGLFLTSMEKKSNNSDSNMVTINSVNMVRISDGVASGSIVDNDKENNLNIVDKKIDDDDELEVLGETMSFDVPIIISAFDELEDIETI